MQGQNWHQRWHRRHCLQPVRRPDARRYCLGTTRSVASSQWAKKMAAHREISARVPQQIHGMANYKEPQSAKAFFPEKRLLH